jgi:hypothetical protein
LQQLHPEAGGDAAAVGSPATISKADTSKPIRAARWPGCEPRIPARPFTSSAASGQRLRRKLVGVIFKFHLPPTGGFGGKANSSGAETGVRRDS